MVLCTVHLCLVPPDEVKLIESDKKLRMHPVMILLPIGECSGGLNPEKVMMIGISIFGYSVIVSRGYFMIIIMVIVDRGVIFSVMGYCAHCIVLFALEYFVAWALYTIVYTIVHTI